MWQVIRRVLHSQGIKHGLTICFFQLFSWCAVFSQTSYYNLGFESGSLINWSGATGSCCPVIANTPGVLPGRQEAVTGNSFDPHSSGLVTIVAPGSMWSAKLGNDNGSAESERLGLSFRVPSDSLLLILRFALVFENANHPPSKQPRFSYQVTSNGSGITGCTEETIISGDTSHPFNVSGMMEILPWQYRLIDLTGHLNDSIFLHFETGDCEPGGHFGYGYVDCDLIPAQLNGTFCNPDGSMTIHAPHGISGTWNGGSTGDSLVISNPVAGTSIQFLPDYGCGIVLQKETYVEIPSLGVSMQPMCNQLATFEMQIDTSLVSAIHWTFGDASVSDIFSPIHQYAQPGSYTVSAEAILTNNCMTRTELEITIADSPVAAFEVNPACPGKPITISNNSVVINYTASPYNWFLDGLWIFSGDLPGNVLSDVGGNMVTLVVTDQFNCTDTLSTWIMPAISDTCNDQLLQLWVPGAFTPNGDGINDFFEPVFSKPASFLEIVITNRYGRKVFEGRSWDGGECPQGVYVCRIRYGEKTEEREWIGVVSLVR